MNVCSAVELKEKLARGDEFLLLDVRNDEELAIARLQKCFHIPLGELEVRTPELDAWKAKEIVVMCHHGMRSQMALHYLASKGFLHVRNLSGGIDAYSAYADPSVPRY